MKDLRTFLLEEYDADDKHSVLEDFAKFLSKRLNTFYDANANTYQNDKLWWAIGNGGGAYRDSRLTVGTKGTAVENDTDLITLSFLVSDNGKLIAYLDAEDHDLLYNTPAFEKNEVNGYKRLSQWDIGVTEEQEFAAFESALKIINKFFNDGNEMRNSIVDDATSSYSKQDLERLEKLLASRETQTFAVWDNVSESNLQSAYAEHKQLKQNIKYYEGAKQAAIMVKDKTAVMEADTKLEELNKRLSAVETDIADMEEDKLNYMKRFKDTKTRAQESEPERDKAAQDWEKTKHKFADALVGTPKLTKTGNVRKQRTVKTGDVSDFEAKEQENARKEVKQKAKNFTVDWSGFEF